MKPIPEYYDGMYLDGYTNEEILQAARNKITRMDEERRAEELLQKKIDQAVKEAFEREIKSYFENIMINI
jgi:hypothetical protein